MKNLTTIVVLIFLNYSLMAQSVTSFQLGYLWSSPTCNPYKDDPTGFWDNWGVSHGTPGAGDIYNDGFYDGAILTGSFDTDTKSEGLYISYVFDKTHSYDIVFSLAHYNGGQVGFAAYAANNVSANTNTTCDEGTLPTVSDKDEIYSSQSVYDGSTGSLKSYEILGYIPNSNYDQLWLHSFQLFYQSTGSLIWTDVTVYDNGVVDIGEGGDAGPDNLRVMDNGNGTFRLSWDPSYDPDGISRYRIYYGNNYYSFTSTTDTFKDIAIDCRTRYYSVKSQDNLDNFSSRSYLIKINSSENFTLSPTNFTGHKTEIYWARNYITLSNGFEYKASTYNGTFSAKINNCSVGSSSGRMSATTDEDGYRSQKSDTTIYHEKNYVSLRESVFTIDRLLDDQILLYPNPTKGVFTLDLGDIENESVSILVFNTTGSLVHKSIINNSITNVIDLANQPKGIYHIKISGIGINESRTIILE